MKMTPAEMNEQVALRLGLKFHPGPTPRVAGLDLFPNGAWETAVGFRATENLPPWSTDDGRAFKELWPRILGINPHFVLGCQDGRMGVGSGSGVIVGGVAIHWAADTWAEAICAAFIDLVPLGGAK